MKRGIPHPIQVFSSMDLPGSASTAIRLAYDQSHADDNPARHEVAVLDKVALDRHSVAVHLARLARRRGARCEPRWMPSPACWATIAASHGPSTGPSCATATPPLCALRPPTAVTHP